MLPEVQPLSHELLLKELQLLLPSSFVQLYQLLLDVPNGTALQTLSRPFMESPPEQIIVITYNGC